MTFEELIAVAEQDATAVDFAALRAAYIASERYEPTAHFSEQKLKGYTNSARDFDEVVVLCKKVLQQNPMDLEVRMMLEFAYDQLEWHDLAVQTHAFVTAMLDAIVASGDGKSLQSAWQVVSVAEEYTLASVMALKTSGQQLVEAEGRYYDILTCVSRKDPDAEPVDLHFDITAPYTYLQDQIK